MSPILQAKANGSAFGYGMFVPAGAGGAFESIASATGTGSSGTITFSSIPSTYQHLQIRWISRSTTAATSFYAIKLQFNSDTNQNYARHQLYGSGAAVFVDGIATGTDNFIEILGSVPGDSNTASVLGSGIIDLHNYASTSQNKTIRAFSGTDMNGSGRIGLHSGLYTSTSAISSISLIASSGNFTSTSQFALYGIKGA